MSRAPKLARAALEPTYSTKEVMEHLGCEKTKLHELFFLGRKHKGVHPLLGGLWPTYRLSHKNRRTPAGAIERHKAHMLRLETDAMFRAECHAKARALGGRRYGRKAEERTAA